MSKNTTTTSYPRPELFWADDDENEPEPLKAPIATVHVWKLGTNGEKEQIDVTTLDALPNRNAFRDAYGPGIFEVSGRASSGAIVAKSTFRIALRPGQVWQPPSSSGDPTSPAPAPMPTNGGATDALALLVQQMNSRGADPTMTLLLTHVLSLSKEMATQSRQSSAELMNAITQLAGARIQDQQGLFESMLRMKQHTTGAAGGADSAKVFKEGMQFMQNLIDAGAQAEAEGRPVGQDDLQGLLRSFLDAVGAAKRADNVVDMPKPSDRAAS